MVGKGLAAPGLLEDRLRNLGGIRIAGPPPGFLPYKPKARVGTAEDLDPRTRKLFSREL